VARATSSECPITERLAPVVRSVFAIAVIAQLGESSPALGNAARDPGPGLPRHRRLAVGSAVRTDRRWQCSKRGYEGKSKYECQSGKISHVQVCDVTWRSLYRRCPDSDPMSARGLWQALRYGGDRTMANRYGLTWRHATERWV
jgi:hypothetical protein